MLHVVAITTLLHAAGLLESVFWPIKAHQQIVRTPQNASHINILNEVENQGACGSCWAYTVTTLVEAAIAQKYGNTASGSPELSPQHLLDCTSYVKLPGMPKGFSNMGCDGGYEAKTIELLVSNDFVLCTEDSYTTPWTNRPEKCTERTNACHGIADVKSADTKYRFRNSAGAVIKQELNATYLKEMVAAGPTGVFLFTPTNFRTTDNLSLKNFSIWEEDIPPICKTDISACTSHADTCGCHAAVLVGYGTDATTKTDYWILANSWGTAWGKDGYARVKRGNNLLGIESVRAVRVTDVNLTSVLPQKTSETTINVNVYTEPRTTTYSNATTAGIILVSILVPVLFLSLYCTTWPMDNYSAIPQDYYVDRPKPPDVVVVSKHTVSKHTLKKPHLIEFSPAPVATPFPGPARVPEQNPPPSAPPLPGGIPMGIPMGTKVSQPGNDVPMAKPVKDRTKIERKPKPDNPPRSKQSKLIRHSLQNKNLKF